MTRDKHKNINNRTQYNPASSEPNFPTTASPGYSNTPKKQDSDLKSHLMKMIEDLKEDINNSINETGHSEENTIKQVKKLNKTQRHKNGIRNNKRNRKEPWR